MSTLLNKIMKASVNRLIELENKLVDIFTAGRFEEEVSTIVERDEVLHSIIESNCTYRVELECNGIIVDEPDDINTMIYNEEKGKGSEIYGVASPWSFNLYPLMYELSRAEVDGDYIFIEYTFNGTMKDNAGLKLNIVLKVGM